MNHKQKTKAARKMISKKELSVKGQRLFDTFGWDLRRKSIAQRVERHVRNARERKAERLEKLLTNKKVNG